MKLHRSHCRKTSICTPPSSCVFLRTYDIIVGTIMLTASVTGNSVELLLLYICAGISCRFLKALCGFPLEVTLIGSLTLDRRFCQVHLPILPVYHHLDNAGCILTACVSGSTFLLCGAQMNVRQQLYIILLDLAIIHKQGQGVMKYLRLFN